MLCSSRQHPMLQLFQTLLPRLFFLSATLALAACGDSDSPLAPGGVEEAPVTADEALQASAPEALAATLSAQRITFASYRNGNEDIYSMDPQGYNVKRLTTVSAYEVAPAWSWDNKRIALVRPRKDAANVTHSDIYLINADGSNGHWARSTPSPYDLMYPSWHPDGSHLLVTVAKDGKWYVGWLQLASGVIGNVAIGGQAVLGKQASYDATGQRIVYVSTSSYKYTLDVVNANGTGHATLLSASGSTIDRPAFSQDGKQIAFANTASNGDYEIFVRKADGSIKRLTYSTGTDGWPTWSPDGSKIVFTSGRNGKAQLWSMIATGGSATRLSHNSYSEQTPAYSH
jgi:Tol biopolymer transport system component